MNNKQLRAFKQLIAQINSGAIIEVIDLSHYKLSDHDIAPLWDALKKQQTYTKKLILAHNHLTTVKLYDMPMLETLDLRGNPLEHFDPNQFPHVKNILIDPAISRQITLAEVSLESLQKHFTALHLGYIHRLAVACNLQAGYDALLPKLPKDLVTRILYTYLEDDFLTYMLHRINKLAKERMYQCPAENQIFQVFLVEKYPQLLASMPVIMYDMLATKPAPHQHSSAFVGWSFTRIKDSVKSKLTTLCLDNTPLGGILRGLYYR